MNQIHWLLLGLCLLAPGCTAMQTARTSTKAVVEALTPESWEESNPADDPGDPWIEQAGLEGRSDQPREDAGDPLGLRKYTMSARARAIERNVGIGD
jgi:hypothetical protein